MFNDKTTLKDLSIFNTEDGSSIFSLLAHTTTQAGKEVLRKHIQNPPASYEKLLAMQSTVAFLTKHLDKWPTEISNGTLVMLEKYFESADNVSTPPSGLNVMFTAAVQKLLNRGEYHFTQFSLSHLSDFMKGSIKLTEFSKQEGVPELLSKELSMLEEELQHPLVDELVQVSDKTPYRELAMLSYKVRRALKNIVYRMMDIYTRLDAWQSLARATMTNKWSFPTLHEADPIRFQAKGLYHPLLKSPVPYDISFDQQQNFLLLTGANMSGKTTFMRALGVATLLAHMGCGVPAQALTISYLSGIITNMHVEDDILKGESYFFAEVKRMKLTAEKLVKNEPHIVLMDELFKGTNVHDAYECTRGVIEGLLHKQNHMLVLSTHLYEVAQHFKDRSDILFAYFVTELQGSDSYNFKYELKEGISNDRIGYRILQKEGVLDMLKKR